MNFVISDLHGYSHDRFLELLEKAKFSDDDFLYILGDVIDRNGDGGVETLQWLLYQPNAQLILGKAKSSDDDFLYILGDVIDRNGDYDAPNSIGGYGKSR